MKGFYAVLLLLLSNIVMTLAWYGHLKFGEIKWLAKLGLFGIILFSWGIAFFEYCLMVPANRWGFTSGFNGFQLKMTQEVITLVVFTVFAVFYLHEPFHWRYLVSFALLLGAVYFMFKK